MKFKVFLFMFSILNVSALRAEQLSHFIKINQFDECRVRVIEQTPPHGTEIIGDVLFFIGYADRADNHEPLFSLLAQNGFKVVSFDYPSHGETNCGILNLHTYTSLMTIAGEVERAFRTSLKAPLILGGWSTGGLLAVRLLQTNFFTERIPAKLFLLAPGISVYPLVGGDGIIRESTLLSNPNPPHRGPITPISPLITPFFSTNLIANSLLAQHQDLPSNTQTLVILADDKEDLYAKSQIVRVWTRKQKMAGRILTALQCLNSKHEIDNEVEPIGSTARESILAFLTNATVPKSANPTVCPLVH